MKPFDLEAALAGKPVVTRDGNEVTQLHLFEAPSERDVLYGVESGYIESWDRNGQYRRGGALSGRDLFMAPTERKEWVVRCPEYKVMGPFHNIDLAEHWKTQMNRPDCTIHEITIIE